MTRVAIIGGSRTPFAKAGTALAKFTALELAKENVLSTIDSIGLDPQQIDELVYGSVLLNPRRPNLAREIVLNSNLPKSLSAHFVSNNCVTGLVSAAFLAGSISSGRTKLGLAGGVESMSNPTLTLSPAAERFFLSLNYARSLSARLKVISKFKPSFLFPNAPSPKEPSTGLTMGQHCEMSAKEFSISRVAQDEWALGSHQNAAKAQSSGFLAEEIAPLGRIETDNIVRPSTDLAKLAKLSPVFDRSSAGTLTAGNSSSLTDGAACVGLASEEKAKELGLEILGYIEDIQFAGIGPKDGLLMGPAFALTNLLEKNNLAVDEIDRYEIHEAFAAQVLSNLEVWESGWEKYPELAAIGKIPSEKINVNGGSLAIGHPFSATGGRLILSLINELKRNNLKKGVISVCAAGAMAGAVLISR